ncbi:tRNA-uridine aminocarboxypropyltransferase [Oceanicoccus sagamiensis]|uniref:tRNA-uridine aminocarboxypropyltransferase n=1 Tax=Oceanicoccus sagamiensis TaxID=716816 RepID=A0A1X9NB65_9GAMM|nr:tRNA-uridine aminocarboxypropyltransferase [Oceanicoccus sagamiensis]ARN75278.1 hypothetical protein BST96_14845 [Oceanicoccus sagamiensis]
MSRLACQRCLRPPSVCYCHTLEVIDNQWPVYILQHPKEAKHAIGTARIAQLSLKQCQTLIAKKPGDVELLMTNIQPLLVYPGDNSTAVNDIDPGTIQPLLFLDGSWRKTRRMLHESPWLAALPRISMVLPASRYKIRKEPHPTAVSTVEAIAGVLAALERDTQKYQPLLTTMDWMIAQQIMQMGDKTYQKNYSGS